MISFIMMRENGESYYEWELNESVNLREYTFNPDQTPTFIKCNNGMDIIKTPKLFWNELPNGYMSASVKCEQGGYQSTYVSFNSEYSESVSVFAFELIDTIACI